MADNTSRIAERKKKNIEALTKLHVSKLDSGVDTVDISLLDKGHIKGCRALIYAYFLFPFCFAGSRHFFNFNLIN